MDDKFSFIPKKTPSKPVYAKKAPSLFLVASFIILLISGLFLAGGYFYKKALASKINSLNESVKRAEDILDPVFIKEVQDVDEKIEMAKALLDNHILITPIFDFLEQSTLQSTRFSSFNFSYAGIDSKQKLNPSITLNGIAKNYNSLALQAQEFKKNNVVKNVIFSSFSLDDKGRVNFSAQIEFDPAYLIYQAK